MEARGGRLGMVLLGGEAGLDRKIAYPSAQHAGLYLTGFTRKLKKDRVIVFGETEMAYLRTQSKAEAARISQDFCRTGHACIVVTEKQRVPGYLVEAASRRGIPVFSSVLSNLQFFEEANRHLGDALAESISLHGVLMDVFGIGILIRGESGIGKSETALELVVRGHRLVADDIVEVQKAPPDSIYGRGSELIKHHMEIRGLGIINVRDLFGIAAIRDSKRIQIIVHLVDWQEAQDYDRLGLDEADYTILGVNVPYIRLPVRQGRTLAVIIEIAARNQLLKVMGHHSAQEFQQRLMEKLSGPKPGG